MSLTCCAISLGCPKNRVDTERTLGSLGITLTMVDEVDEAELVFVNTCGFIAPAIEESIQVLVQTIADIQDLSKRPLLVVAGCLVGRFGESSLAPDLPEVDLWLDKRDVEQWAACLRDKLGLATPAIAECTGRLLSTGPSYAWLKISDGCLHQCSFCSIPTICGPYRSHSLAFLEDEAKRLLDEGVQELVLIAQDVSAWGHDSEERHGLRTLLDRLAPLSGLARLRMLYMYPTGLSKDFLQYLKELGEPFVPYFDVPLQHSNASILDRMGRPFAQNPREVIERIRTVFPDAALRTTLIVGFPGETEAQYNELVDFVEEVKFQHLGVFSYEAEDGTPAAIMPDQVPEEVKLWRRDSLMERQTDISAEYLESFVGEQQTVLIDSVHPEWPNLYIGRTWFQAPEIDGITYISGENIEPGSLVLADIVESKDYDLVALV